MADERRDFFTPTLGGLYERQGHLDRAAEVYRFLLDRDPDRDDLRKALAQVERKLFTDSGKSLEETIPTLCRWLSLLVAYGNLTRLRKTGGGKLETGNWKLETRNSKLETRNLTPDT